jgi:predicted TIM-barrel fold metal-dependent hydrolase
MALIDIHPHVVSTDTARFPLSPIGEHQSDWSQQRPVTYEAMIQAMDAAGVAKAAVVQASSVYAFDNSYVAAAVAAHPTRFTGVFSVDLIAPDAVDRMKHWIGQGLTGMRLYTAGTSLPEQTVWFADPRTFQAWGFAGEAAFRCACRCAPRAFPSSSRWSSVSRMCASSSITWRAPRWRTARPTRPPRRCSSSRAIPTSFSR